MDFPRTQSWFRVPRECLSAWAQDRSQVGHIANRGAFAELVCQTGSD